MTIDVIRAIPPLETVGPIEGPLMIFFASAAVSGAVFKTLDRYGPPTA
jgi:hypothetical protein